LEKGSAEKCGWRVLGRARGNSSRQTWMESGYLWPVLDSK